MNTLAMHKLSYGLFVLTANRHPGGIRAQSALHFCQ